MLLSLLMSAVAFAASALVERGSDGAPPTEAAAAQMRQRFIQEHGHEIEQRSRAILSETLSKDAPEWAGSYSTGGGFLNVTIDIAPNGGAVYTRHGCMGVQDANLGVVERVAADRVRVKWHLDPRANEGIHLGVGRSTHVSNEMYFVDWGDERYLLSSGQMLAFCNWFNAGPRDVYSSPFQGEPRPSYPSGPRRHRRPQEASQSSPSVPAEFRAHVLAAPISTTIASIEDAREKTERTRPGGIVELRAVVHVGREHGLLRGMILWIQEPDDPWIGEVTDVGPTESTVMFRGPRVGTSQLARAGKIVSTRKL